MQMIARKKWAFSLLLMVMLGVAVGSAQSQRNTNSQTVSIQIVAYVPPTLNLKLDFSQDGSLRLNGRVEGESAVESRGSQSFTQNNPGSSDFNISSDATIVIGNASLFSNLPGSYSIIVFSANGGVLKNSSIADATPIPYRLMFGDTISSAQQGSFRFALGGKAGKSSPDFPVALNFGDLQAEKGDYSDNLSFSIIAG